MGLQASAYVTVNPSFAEPEIILPIVQASGWIDTLAGSDIRVRLGEDDLQVYMKRLDLRTKMLAGTAATNSLPGVTLTASQISTPTYLLSCRAEYNHHDTAAAARWGFALPEAYRLGMWQANFQLARDAGLYGFNPQNGEGLVNTSGATSLNLPADSNGDTTVVTYDNGEMAFFFLDQIGKLKSRTNQLGIGKTFAILGPQRVLAQFEYPGIVQLVQYQRVGAGTATTATVVKETLMQNGDRIFWCYDDTLQGQGPNGTDTVLIVMPEVDKPEGDKLSTNIFSTLGPGNPTCTTMYADMAAPREIISPLPGGATDVLTEWRITGGWAVRPEAVTIVWMPYQ